MELNIKELINSINLPNPIILYGVCFLVLGIGYILKIFFRNDYKINIFPELWEQLFKNKIKFIIFVVFTLFLIGFVDIPVAKFCNNHLNRTFYHVIDVIANLAQGWVLGSILICVIIWLKLIYNPSSDRISKLFEISFIAMLFAGVFNGVLKFIFNRQRPAIGLDNWHFFYFFRHPNNIDNLFYAFNSMPSGHTVSIVAALMPFLLYTKKIRLKIFYVLLMLLVIIGRVYTLNHWMSDIFVSSVLGVMIGYACYMANSKHIMGEKT